MASLAVQSLRNFTIEQILDIGFDRLPTTDEFYKALAAKIDSKIIPYYVNNWIALENELLLIYNNEATLINYAGATLYWTRRNEGYLLLIMNWLDGDDIKDLLLSTFDDIVREIIKSFNKQKFSVRTPYTKSNEFDFGLEEIVILHVMSQQHDNEIESLLSSLTHGDVITFSKLPILSIDPFIATVSGAIVFDNDRLSLIGIKEEIEDSEVSDDEDIDPEIDEDKSYTIYNFYFEEDINLFLAILTYNPDTYKLLGKYSKI